MATILCNCERQYDPGDDDCLSEQSRLLKKILLECGGLNYVKHECIAYSREPEHVWDKESYLADTN
jgi:hypothetical protein